MPPQESSKPEWKLVIASHDGNKDLWPYFFHFLQQYWPDAPKPVHMITNHASFDSPDVKCIHSGQDRAWSDVIRESLPAIEAEYMLFMLDDMFLCTDVDVPALEAVFREFIERQGLFCELHIGTQDVLPYPVGSLIRNIPDTPLVAGINCAFWKKDFLAKACVPGRTIWKVDAEVRRLNKLHRENMFYVNTPLPTLDYVESVRGGFWKPEGMEFLEKHGMRPDLFLRPYPPQGRDWFCKVYRSMLKRGMRLRRRWQEAAGEDIMVQPFRNSC